MPVSPLSGCSDSVVSSCSDSDRLTLFLWLFLWLFLGRLAFPLLGRIRRGLRGLGLVIGALLLILRSIVVVFVAVHHHVPGEVLEVEPGPPADGAPPVAGPLD